MSQRINNLKVNLTKKSVKNMMEEHPLPKDWKYVRLGEICKFEYGSSLPERQRLMGSISVFGSNGVIGYHNIAITQGPAIIIGRKGSIGQVNYSSNPCWPIDTTYYIDSSKTSCNLIWLFWILKALQLDQLNKATGIPSLNREDAYNQKLPLPPLSEQEQIGIKIQGLLQEVEHAKIACEKQLKAAKALPSAYLREVFESEEAKKWERKKLEKVCRVIMGQSPPGHTYTNEPRGSPFFQGKADFGEYFPTIKVWCTQPIKIAKEGDILLSVRAPAGPVNLSNMKCCIGRGLAAISCKVGIINLFIFWYLTFVKNHIASLGSGSTFSAINRNDLINLQIPLPSLIEQKRITAELKEKMKQIGDLNKTIEKKLESINALPQAILEKAFRREL